MTRPTPDVRPIRPVQPPTLEEELLPIVQLAFARLHKAAFGAATGVAAAVLMGALTLMALIRPESRSFPLGLLGEYFAGYEVTWPGLLIGMAWGFLVGFVAGWFVAFCRNFSLAIIAFWFRARAELQATRNFLDHI